MREYDATVTRIIDGRTIDVSIDLGFNAVVRRRIVIEGIKKPALDSDLHVAAQFLTDVLLGGDPESARVILVDPHHPAPHDYWTADVLMWHGESVSELLIAAGYADAS